MENDDPNTRIEEKSLHATLDPEHPKLLCITQEPIESTPPASNALLATVTSSPSLSPTIQSESENVFPPSDGIHHLDVESIVLLITNLAYYPNKDEHR